MRYELMKKLHDARFPNLESDWIDEIGHVTVHPTLSELIESCGEGARCLLNKGDGTGWAYAVNGVGASGETPEEAVANLWLKLNKK